MTLTSWAAPSRSYACSGTSEIRTERANASQAKSTTKARAFASSTLASRTGEWIRLMGRRASNGL